MPFVPQGQSHSVGRRSVKRLARAVGVADLALRWTWTECEETGLVFEGNNRAAVPAKRRYFLQVPVRAGNCHYRTVAVDGVTAGGKVPTFAFGPLAQLGRGLA